MVDTVFERATRRYFEACEVVFWPGVDVNVALHQDKASAYAEVAFISVLRRHRKLLYYQGLLYRGHPDDLRRPDDGQANDVGRGEGVLVGPGDVGKEEPAVHSKMIKEG